MPGAYAHCASTSYPCHLVLSILAHRREASPRISLPTPASLESELELELGRVSTFETLHTPVLFGILELGVRTEAYHLSKSTLRCLSFELRYLLA